MKIKKSQLIQLIKEEIMAEAEMFKMSPEDLADFSQPDPPEYRAADEVFNMVMEDLEKEVEDDLLDIIKQIMMERPGRKPQDMAKEGIENINAENMQIVADALQKMAPLIGVMSLPVLIGLIYEQLKGMGAK